MPIKVQRLTLTTDASGDVVASTRDFVGLLHALVYVPGASGLDTGADVTVTDKTTLTTLWAATNAGTSTLHRQPRCPTVDAANAASLYAAGGEPVEDRYAIVGGITVTVAQGGNAKTGSIYFVYET